MDYILTAEKLGKRYGHANALSGFNMHIPKGSIYGFVGRNGAGKTTLIRISVVCRNQRREASLYTVPRIQIPKLLQPDSVWVQ